VGLWYVCLWACGPVGRCVGLCMCACVWLSGCLPTAHRVAPTILAGVNARADVGHVRLDREEFKDLGAT